MTQPQLHPERITKPIQLLAAWLAGLVLVDGAFLTAAAYIKAPAWAAALLVVAAVANVPIFIAALFLLQTRYRPEMQEDSFYSRYLERQYSPATNSGTFDITRYTKQLTSEIVSAIGPHQGSPAVPVERAVRQATIQQLAGRYRFSRTIAELHSRADIWPRIVNMYAESQALRRELDELQRDGIVALETGEPESAKLTPLGGEVASHLEKSGGLWSLRHAKQWADDAARAKGGA